MSTQQRTLYFTITIPVHCKLSVRRQLTSRLNLDRGHVTCLTIVYGPFQRLFSETLNDCVERLNYAKLGK